MTPRKPRAGSSEPGRPALCAMRLVDVNKEVSQPEVIWTSATYASFWNYYPYGWGSTFTIVPGRNDTKIKIETLGLRSARRQADLGGNQRDDQSGRAFERPSKTSFKQLPTK